MAKYLYLCQRLIFVSILKIINKHNVKKYFKERNRITKSELKKSISEDYPNLKGSSIDVYISRLKKEGIIQNPMRNYYQIEEETVFSPLVDKPLQKISNRISKLFPFVNFCVWDSLWLNDMMQHQMFKTFKVVEVEKDAVEQVFQELNNQYKSVFFEPNEEIFERYISSSNNVIIVKRMVSESPLIQVEKTPLPSIEKLLVDCFTDTTLFASQQAEMEFIYQSAFEKYSINIAKMKRYASRRNKRQEITKLINLTLAKK